MPVFLSTASHRMVARQWKVVGREGSSSERGRGHAWCRIHTRGDEGSAPQPVLIGHPSAAAAGLHTLQWAGLGSDSPHCGRVVGRSVHSLSSSCSRRVLAVSLGACSWETFWCWWMDGGRLVAGAKPRQSQAILGGKTHCHLAQASHKTPEHTQRNHQTGSRSP